MARRLLSSETERWIVEQHKRDRAERDSRVGQPAPPKPGATNTIIKDAPGPPEEASRAMGLPLAILAICIAVPCLWITVAAIAAQHW